MRRFRTIILLVNDMVLVNLAYLLAIRFVYIEHNTQEFVTLYYKECIVVTIIYLVCFFIFKLYHSLWDYTGTDEFLLGISGSVLAGVLTIAYTRTLGETIPLNVSVIAIILVTIFVIGLRIVYRVYRRIKLYIPLKDSKFNKRVMVVGAGSAGSMIINEMLVRRELNMTPIVVIDDSKDKRGKKISGVKVLGNRNDIKTLVVEKDIDTIIIAIPTINKKNKQEIITICQQTACDLRIIPGMYEIISGEVDITKVKKVELEDLLERDVIKLNDNEIKEYVTGKNIIVTGGGGSIGSELCRQIAIYNPSILIIFDIYENNAYDIQNELLNKYPQLNLEVIIGSVRDRDRLEQVFEEYNINVVFHAAAHKHVPLMENSPKEAIKNNVFGTYNLADISNRKSVDRFVLISTDKAVNPTNIMGATKRLCEMIIQSFNTISRTEFVAVRFGNVLGSNGSVIPLFKSQIGKGGPVTVTDKKITRYFMLIPEAAQLVLQAGAFAKGGEIFVLDMGNPVKIYDLACNLIRLSGFEPNRDIKIDITGLRPGEKLYEELLMSEEGLTKTKHNKIYIGRPIFENMNDLQMKLELLKELLEESNIDIIKRKMVDIVPTYSFKPEK